MFRIFFLVFLLLAIPFVLTAGSPITDVELVRSEARQLGNGKKTTWLDIDKNGDGRVEQTMLLDSKGEKLYEELDYNGDGKMDDFCFFSGGALEREEIDTNFDGHVDLWVYLKRGIYVEMYERDTDFDGKIDKVKKFGPKK